MGGRKWTLIGGTSSSSSERLTPFFFFLFFLSFNSNGCFARVDILPEKTTLTATYYTEPVLRKSSCLCMTTAQWPKPGKSRHRHDRASPHKAKVTESYLQKKDIEVLDHPPFSPDFDPCGCWCFSTLNEQLVGRKFTGIQNLSEAVISELNHVPASSDVSEAATTVCDHWTDILRKFVGI